MAVAILVGTHLSINKLRALSVTSGVLRVLEAAIVSLVIGKWKQNYLS